MYQGAALNADERDWLTDARRERQEAPRELEYVAQRLWAVAQLKRLQEDRL